jgi:hypothetical protein
MPLLAVLEDILSYQFVRSGQTFHLKFELIERMDLFGRVELNL